MVKVTELGLVLMAKSNHLFTDAFHTLMLKEHIKIASLQELCVCVVVWVVAKDRGLID